MLPDPDDQGMIEEQGPVESDDFFSSEMLYFDRKPWKAKDIKAPFCFLRHAVTQPFIYSICIYKYTVYEGHLG